MKDTFKKVCKDISKAQHCLERLEKIALKPNPLTELQYIDLLIKSEKNEARPGWEKRVKCYEKAREMAVLMADARKGEISHHMKYTTMKYQFYHKILQHYSLSLPCELLTFHGSKGIFIQFS